jgi:hypothetical protein
VADTWRDEIRDVIRTFRGDFTLTEVYQRSAEVIQNHPENNTPEDTIRRVLQELRDEPSPELEFLGDGDYRRTASRDTGALTPADLALELGFSQTRVRDVLRERYGTLPPDQPRWDVDDEMAAHVRSRLRRETGQITDWVLSVGDDVPRRRIHGAYGGQQQGGISTPRSVPDILIFTDPKAGAKYGYDEFEGLKEDGSYSYTGEGQYGNQEFVRGNLAIRDSARDGRVIRLFTTNGTRATYVGAFATGEPTYSIETIPDLDGNPREGIIFNLVPIDADERLLPAYGGAIPIAKASVVPWTPPEHSDVVLAPLTEALVGERVVTRLEFELQSDFGEWLRRQGTSPSTLKLPVGRSTIEPDLYVEERGWIVEAKRSTGRVYVRTAIGQVLDYVHMARKSGIDASPVILLPSRPDQDLANLLAELEITLIFRSESGFEVVDPDSR